MKNFEIKYEYNGYNNELKGIMIDNKMYRNNELSFEARELLTVMSYSDYKCSKKYFDDIAKMIGYDTTLQAILDLQELGAHIVTAEIYRQLVMNSFKNKYKGMMRQ